MATLNRAMVIKRLEDEQVREKLRAMERNPLLNTVTASFSSNTELYPDGKIPFIDKHISYL
ncbi:MAG: hypothetical protein ACREF7_00510, partial [Candidatus Saccharimonadales bacterium]